MKYVLIIVAALFGIVVVGNILGWFGEGVRVARDEFGPEAMLAKYEWFIDQSARIKKADEDVAIFRARAEQVERAYGEYGPKEKWLPHIQVQYQSEKSTARDDLVAVLSMRNTLARDYNAQSAKFNWEPFKTRPDAPAERYEELAPR